MDSIIVQAWIKDVAIANMPDTPSPKKRSRTSHNDEIAPLDLEKTPVRHSGSSTRSASTFQAALVNRPAFSAIQPSSRTSRSRSSSPSKRFQKIGDLLTLAVPVHFTQTPKLSSALPTDAQGLYTAMSTVRGKVRLLPAVLRSHPDFEDDNEILDFMWSDDVEGQDTAEHHEAARRNHEELRRIVAESTEASNEGRFESGWNNLVHTPILKLATRDMPFLMIEPIMSAQIMPAFRPLLASGQQILLPSSSSVSSATGSSRASGHGGEAAAPAPRSVDTVGLSVHKMVDYAVALRPSDTLRALIDAFLLGEPQERDSINQTRYTPLQKRPAPIFIETKTTSGVQDGASVQLGVWLAAWYERLRTLTALAGSPQEKLLTLPLLQVTNATWTLMFAVDEGTQIRVRHRNWMIGETNSPLGIYQLQASLVVLGKWMKNTFEPWFTDLLERAVEGRGTPRVA
ncbi:hypothetical protein MY11210_001616 [Beauveria gryllotalpidicola]